MKTVLQVGAVIESHTPPAWVNEILQAINAHEDMQLSVGLHNDSLPSGVGPTARACTKVADWLLEKVIDIPQFNNTPWQPDALPANIELRSVEQLPAALAQCDVILYLTRHRPLSAVATRRVPVWTTDLPMMDIRVKHCLLNRAPFIWIHLWNLQADATSGSVASERITSHALPCQSYSISDLQRSCYSALPSVFMSRLNWLSNHPDHQLDSLDVQAGNQGVFDTEKRQALLDASTSTDHNNDGHLASELKVLWKTTTLLLRQSYERVHNKLFTEHWQLAVAYTPDASSLSLNDIAEIPVHTYTCVGEPPDVMWADPHLCEYEGDVYVFFEKMHQHRENAHIAYAKLDEKGQLVNSGVALSAKHHLSFPHIFNHADSYYMIPETASLRSVNLYKATRFPDQWEHQHELLSDINAADTVLLPYEGRWWMFTNCHSHRVVDERDELHIFFADTLEGPWQAHAQNPVLTGVDRSRMAGPIIHERGKLYRSSQYGAYRYGYGVNISRIDELSPTIYRESAEWRILPEDGAGWSGCHTFGRLGNLTIVDRVRFSRR